ncbi:15275_t:CDS:2, partial [Cetraspora pellucida]
PDIQDAISFLKKEGYQVESYKTSHQSTSGFVFAHPKQLEKLQRYGWLTLIDSTHKTNKYDWHLFTLYVWDGTWKPRYFLADQSSIETKSIMTVFPGLSKDEQECDVIFCTVHVMRTWMNKIYESETRSKMIQAMHKRTKIDCDMFVQKAINECTLSPVKKYISRYYSENTHQWALWARQHSPLLLQITSTNALESYHSELKRTTSPQYGLIGACNKIVVLDLKKQSDSDYVAFEFRVKKISAVGVEDDVLKKIHKFPFPIQKLIINEVLAFNDRIEKGKGLPGLLSLECHCLFFRKYMLPCKHILHKQMYSLRKLLIAKAWKQFQQMFDEGGFEIYEHRELVRIEFPEKNEIDKAAENRRLTVNELMERTRNEYWSIKESGGKKEKAEFIQKLKFCLDSVLKK